ncbi:glycosyltransferase family 2 protein [Luteipulveratus mongoliensis]|uniref:glycosyltransferase family 2 protein n=1 Tax=Luteipulveratus mongoliensis TaxID=571913 RepID=UPI0006983125|nr:glycosyltransferase family 2 protein [Luteipulveratus mongoliensis]
MPTPLLSIVVPYYGVEAYLHDCLESLRRQTLTDFEVVMVDDGSPDNSIEIAERFCARDERFKLVIQENQGLGPARNTGTAHAHGEFITYVDSDDLVPFNAYAQMVGSLQRTGSSFVLGNAKRFSRTSGVRQSWTHQKPCATPRLATHVLERPELVMDRMVWNKVYRRSFWDEYGYAFPPIRYEDYPVTLKAHLDALTVDVINTPTYFWRERESGDSITQQVFRYDNLLDRVVSAEMVLDILDQQASPEVRQATHDYFTFIDVIALAQAFAVVPEEDVERTIELGQRLVNRLQVNIGSRPRFDQIQWHALRAGDAELLHDLAVFRDEGGLVGGGHVHRRRSRPWEFDADFPGRGRSTAPAKTYAYPMTSLRLRSTVDHVAWMGSTVTLRGTAEISHLPMVADSELEASLINGIQRIPLAVKRFETVDQHADRTLVGFEVSVDLEQVDKEYELVWPLRFELDLRVGSMRRKAHLGGPRGGSPNYPHGHWLSDHEWIQPGRGTKGAYVLHRVADPVIVTGASATDGHLVLECLSPDRLRRADVVIARTAPATPVTIAAEVIEDERGSRVIARIPGEQALEGDYPDDPFTLRSVRALRLDTDLGSHNLTWPAHHGAVSLESGDELVSLVRTPFGLANLTHGPANPSAVTARVDGSDLVVEGVEWSSLPPTAFSWRRFLPGSDDYAEASCDVVRADGRWQVTVPSAQLIPEVDQPIQPGAPAGEWTLFVELATGDQAVACQAALASVLPLDWEADGRHLTLTTVAETVRAQVR